MKFNPRLAVNNTLTYVIEDSDPSGGGTRTFSNNDSKAT